MLAFAALAGVLVAQASGRRDPGDTATGSVDQSITEKLNEAGRCFSEGDADCAIELYDEVLDDQPDQRRGPHLQGLGARTCCSATPRRPSTTLIEAATRRPASTPTSTPSSPWCSSAAGSSQQASNELDRLDALDPPPDVLAQIEGLRAQVDAALAAAGHLDHRRLTRQAGGGR